MAKKTRLKTDAFDWVQDTSRTADHDEAIKPPSRLPKAKTVSKAAAPKPKPIAKRAVVETKKEPLQPPAATAAREETRPPSPPLKTRKERLIYVKFKKRHGEIVAIQEIFLDRKYGIPWTGISNDQDAAEILLTGELAKIKLIDVHENYKVTKSGRTVKLVPKG